MLLLLLACLAITDTDVQDRLRPTDSESPGDSTDSTTDSTGDSDTSQTHDTSDSAGQPCGSGRDRGPALQFASTTDTVRIADSDLLDFTAKWTVEMWVWYEGTPGVLIEKYEEAVEEKTFRVGVGGDLEAKVSSGGDEGVEFRGQALAADGWHHVAFVADGLVLTVFHDGTPGGLTTWAGDLGDGTGELHFGSYDRRDQDAFKGYLADVRISGFARYAVPFVPDAYLQSDADTVGLWAMDEGEGTVVSDATGHNLAGTIAGPTWGERPCRVAP